MNLVKGKITKGVFKSKNIKVNGFGVNDGSYILGFRAEDAKLKDEGNLKGPVFSVELLGDATMLTLRIDETFVSVKVQKDYNSKIGKEVFISVPKNICHLYNIDTGERIT